MPAHRAVIEFENIPYESKMRDEDAALAAIAAQHPEYISVTLLGVGGTMGSSQRRAEYAFDVAPPT